MPLPFARKLTDLFIQSAAHPGIALAALTPTDLPTIRHWLEKPHVARWWSPADKAVSEVAKHIEDDYVAPFLMSEAGRPVGYLQAYHANDEPFWAGHDLPRESFGVDLFIGEDDCLGRGLGPRFLRLMIARLFEMPEVVRVHIDPDPVNEMAVKAYSKAGFQHRGPIDTPDGLALYMTIERRNVGAARAMLFA